MPVRREIAGHLIEVPSARWSRKAILNRTAASTLVLFLAIFAGLASAQNPSGTLRGVIQDQTGARIGSAMIALSLADTSAQRTGIANQYGEFRFDGLAPGTWSIRVTSRGFGDAAASVSIAVSAVRDISVTMKPGASITTVGVKGEGGSIAAQPIDLGSSVHQAIATSQDLESLPLPARSFANVAYLAPGTEPVEPSDPTKARITAVSTGGSSGLNNELSVDGADNSDDYIGGFLQNFSPDSVEEFAVRTSQEDADTGGTTAGSVVITTKSGTNKWHGQAAFYDRTAALNARFPIENPPPNPKQPFSRQNYVATVGGKIVKDKLWSFTAFEGIHEDASIAYSQASTTQFDALATLASEGLIPGVPSITVPDNVPIPFRDFFGSERLDWAQSSKSHWFLRSSADSYTTHNDLVQQGTLPSTGLLTHNNYMSLAIGNQFAITSSLLGRFIFNASGLHLTQTRNSHLGFALAFPFSSTSLTISGFETFGDNQFATPITFFPSERNQEKYQFRYDLDKAFGAHAFKFGVNFIHEPILSGSFPGNTETLYTFPQNPTYYLTNTSRFTADRTAGASTSNLGGTFSQNVQRLAFYGQDSWRLWHNFTVNYGLRYSTTYGLFTASGRSQFDNPGYITLAALHIPLVSSTPHDDRNQLAPRLGIAWSPGSNGKTVLRSGFGLYFNDLAQNGWVAAFQALNTPPSSCIDPVANPGGAENAGCISGAASGGTANLIAPNYRTPYAIHISGGVQHAFTDNWALSGDFIHEEGNHAYRAYSYTGGANLFTPLLPLESPDQANFVPNVNVFHSDNRSSYNGLLVHLQGNVSRRANLIANYTFSKGQTWGCVLGELFDYVNGVCNPLNPFGRGDYGPSGEDVRHRAVLAGTWHAPGKVDLSTLTQAETARPFTITTADNKERISINGVPTALDQFRGTPYIQADLRVSRPTMIHDRWTMMPFIEFFNLFNRNNSGANYVTNIASLPVPASQAAAGNVTDICTNASCTSTAPITSLNQLRRAGGALGDFFGPGTTVGIPFAVQIGIRANF
jgi:hypothetical protein